MHKEHDLDVGKSSTQDMIGIVLPGVIMMTTKRKKKKKVDQEQVKAMTEPPRQIYPKARRKAAALRRARGVQQKCCPLSYKKATKPSQGKCRPKRRRHVSSAAGSAPTTDGGGLGLDHARGEETEDIAGVHPRPDGDSRVYDGAVKQPNKSRPSDPDRATAA